MLKLLVMFTPQAEVSWSHYVPAGYLFARLNIGRPRNLCLQGKLFVVNCDKCYETETRPQEITT